MKRLISRYCDFQVHSPRDRRYFGWQTDKMTLAGLEEWVTVLLRECVKRNVGAVAITDHHDLWPGVIALRRSLQLASEVWVFPGMEITSKSGIQAVLLVDASAFGDLRSTDLRNAESKISAITACVGQNITAGPGSERRLTVTPWVQLERLSQLKPEERRSIFLGPDVERLDRDLEGEEGIAHNLDRICKGSYLLLPNLEKNKQGVFGNEYGRAFYLKAESWFLGGYVGGGNATDEDAISGRKVKDYGRRAVTCLRTSDQRGKDSTNWISDRVGQLACGSWLKVSEQTVNSLAQALISGHERRVFEKEPTVPPESIERLEISGTEVFGQDVVSVVFSEHLSTFIGGRGTGKSLLLSALVRLFGADEEWKSRTEEALLPWEARHLALFYEGGPFYGKDVRMAVTFRKESGVIYRMTLEAPGDDFLGHRKLEMKAGESWQQIAVEDAALAALDFHPLFFLQNQMSAITGSRLEQRDLTNLIEGPMRAARASMRGSLEKLSAAVRQGMEAKGRLASLKRQAKELGGQLKLKQSERNAFLEAAKRGLTPEQQEVFSEGESLRKGKAAVEDIENAIQTHLRAISVEHQDLAASMAATRSAMDGLLASKLADFRNDKYVSALVAAARSFDRKLKALIDEIQKELDAARPDRDKHQGLITKLIAKAAEISEQEKTRREALKRAKALEVEIAALGKQMQKLEQDIQKVERSGVIENAEAALGHYRKLVREYSEQLEQRAKAITENESFRLVVRIVPGGRFENVLAKMRSVCEGAGVRSATWIEMEQALAKAKAPAGVLGEVCESMIRAIGESSDKLPSVWKQCGFSEKVFQNIRARTTLEEWVALSVILADDKVDVMYKKGKGKKPIPILSASPGERAVELLKLALHSTTGPLIIDQPEDDLDNHFLAEQLVALVQRAKGKNQLIFASHNANLVVHGDSELIHAMDAIDMDDGKAVCGLPSSGTIDQDEVCRRVEVVMEGGREAFENRRRKYHETVGT